MTKIRIAPGEAAWPARCATCHGALSPDEAVQCPRCATLLHADCRGALAGCPTLGCGARPAPRCSPAAPVAPPRARRRGLALVCAGLALASLPGLVALLRPAPAPVWQGEPALAFPDPPGESPGPQAAQEEAARALFAPLR